MSYYNYHAIAHNLIKNGHCLYAKFEEKHNNISPALVLYFNNHKPMPIRENKFSEYLLLLNYYEINIFQKQS